MADGEIFQGICLESGGGGSVACDPEWTGERGGNERGLVAGDIDLEGLAGERAAVDRLVERVGGEIDGEGGDIGDRREVGRSVGRSAHGGVAGDGVVAERGERVGEVSAPTG